MLNPTFLKLAAELLDMASDVFGNHGCNDFKMSGRFTDEERAAIADLMNCQNLGKDYKSTHASDDDDVRTAEQIKDYACDFALMDAMAYMLRKMADYAESNAVMPSDA